MQRRSLIRGLVALLLGVVVLVCVNSIWLTGYAADRVSWGVIAFVVTLILKGGTKGLHWPWQRRLK